jgi:hypothetical protein
VAVYVDPPMVHNTRVGRISPATPWCHMWADDLEELHALASRIGMRRQWFQDKGSGSLPHYDLTPPKRLAALVAGAIPVDHDTLGRYVRAHRKAHREAVVAKIEQGNLF